MSDLAIERGYAQTDFEIVVHRSGNYELPLSTAARYRLAETVHTATAKAKLETHGYAFVAPLVEEGRLSSKVLDTETNEFFHLKIIGEKVHIYPKDEDFSKATFERLVECIDKHVSGLELEVDSDG